jgi:DNA-binding transcriptional ArsR family regulator
MLVKSCAMINCVDFCKALGDETRQRILEVLLSQGEMCVGDLVNTFNLSQPTISHHLTLLKNAKLVTSRRDGKQVFYAIDRESVTSCCGILFAKFAPEDVNPDQLLVSLVKATD